MGVDITQMGTVLAIVIITYLIGLAAKASTKIKDATIPVIVGTFGGIVGCQRLYGLNSTING